MKTEGYLLLGGIVLLVAIGIFYFIKPNTTQLPGAQQAEPTVTLRGGDQTQQGQVQGEQSPNQQQPITTSVPTPAMEIDQKKTYQAVITTTEGEITVELNASKTPVTVNNFVSLSKKNFYNNTIFHRVIKGFMIQGGDPTGTGVGGPGYSFKDESFDGEYSRGTLAMANAGPNTNGSQFFIMHADTALPKNYVIFGKVTDGLDVVDKIAEGQTKVGPSGENSSPVKPVSIKSVEIIEK